MINLLIIIIYYSILLYLIINFIFYYEKLKWANNYLVLKFIDRLYIKKTDFDCNVITFIYILFNNLFNEDYYS